MNEILKQLLDNSGILSEESKKELEASFNDVLTQSINEAVEQAVEQAKADAEAKTTVELQEKYEQQRSVLIGAIDEKVSTLLESEMVKIKAEMDQVVESAKQEAVTKTTIELHEKYLQQREETLAALDLKVNTFLESEITALKDDIKNFRDLEEEHVMEIAKEKIRMGELLAEQIAVLVEKADAFIELRIEKEVEALKEDILETRKLDFGRRIFEAFLPEYRQQFVDGDSLEKELHEAKTTIDSLKGKFKDVKKEKDELARKVKMESVLKPLEGNARELMESILGGIATERLDEVYKTYIGKVLKESEVQQEAAQEVPQKEPTITSKETEPKAKTVTESAKPIKTYTGGTFVVTGDSNQEPETTIVSEGEDLMSHYMKLAGIN